MKLLERGWPGLYLSKSITLPHVTSMVAGKHLGRYRIRSNEDGKAIHFLTPVSKVRKRYAVLVSTEKNPCAFETVKSILITINGEDCWVSIGKFVEIKSFLT